MPNWLTPAFLLGTVIVHGVLAWIHKTKLSDADRAALLTQLAQDAAAFVVAAYPGKPWADLVNLIVQRLLAGSGTPTQSTQALENAASAALTRMGKAPAAK